MGGMKTKTLLVTLTLSLAAAAVCLASPQMGTWKLNEAKSKITPGATKLTSVVYSTVGDNVKIAVDGVDKDGKPTHNEWIGKFDGKDYPVTGDSGSDARACTRPSMPTRSSFTVKKDGKVIATGKVVVSADGKTRTVTVSGTDAQGEKVEMLVVLRQAIGRSRCDSLRHQDALPSVIGREGIFS